MFTFIKTGAYRFTAGHIGIGIYGIVGALILRTEIKAARKNELYIVIAGVKIGKNVITHVIGNG